MESNSLTTKFYLHNASRAAPPSGSLPTTEQSTLSANQNLDSQSNNHSMNTTVGTSQASFSVTVSSSSTLNYFIGKWVSDLPINQTSIAANTWTWDFAVKQSDTGTNADFPTDNATFTKTYVNLYVWRPTTTAIVGKVLDGLTGTTYHFAGSSEGTEAGTFTGSAVSGITAGTDVLVFEAWANASNGSISSDILSFYFDGTTDPTATSGTAISSAASFISTPENISLGTTSSSMTEVSSLTFANKLITKV